MKPRLPHFDLKRFNIIISQRATMQKKLLTAKFRFEAVMSSYFVLKATIINMTFLIMVIRQLIDNTAIMFGDNDDNINIID